VMPSVFLHSAWLDSSLDTSSLSHPATRPHISLAYPIALVIARICHTLARERFNASVESLSHAMSIMPSVLHSMSIMPSVSGYYSALDEDVLLASNKASRIIAGVLGTVLLLTIVIVLIVMRARQLDSSPDPQSCACLHGYYPKMGCLIASAVLAFITLVLTLASDSESRQCDYGHRIGLMSAALALHVIGGIVLYSLSDCGCRLCLCLCCRCCDRPYQATTAIGFSLLFWFIGMGLYIWVILLLGIYD
jgi:hypothetical protein